MRIGASGDEGLEVPSGVRPEACAESWAPTDTGGAPAGRINHTAVWTGAEMIVWGGVTGGTMPSFTYTNTGGRYVPATDSWSATPTASPCPLARALHSAVWTGTEMIVWGGVTASSYISITCTNAGGRFNPATGVWTATPTSGAPTGRGGHSCVWTGTQMVVWGGLSSCLTVSMTYANTGSRYTPGGSWTATTTANAPSARALATAVSTGEEMIVWGGGNGSYPNLTTTNTGGAYRLSDDTWRATSTSGDCPTARGGQTAVWTGAEMIVWGGGGDGNTNTGARYVPSTDAWAATSTGSNCPVARAAHTALWTGSEMFVWGGAISGSYPDYIYTNTGGLYDPAGDTWRATSTGTNCPTARGGHSAVWENGKAILWSGLAPYTNTGAIYEPLTVCATTEVSPAGAAFPLRLLEDGASPTGYSLRFQRVEAATGYNVYEGTVGGWYDHGSGAACGAPAEDLGTGEMRAEITPSAGNRYFLVTARDAAAEGVSGYGSSGAPIPASQSTCLP
jgi:N-acetylneuraminic acid mutarotase